jgi:hypothetical protein
VVLGSALVVLVMPEREAAPPRATVPSLARADAVTSSSPPAAEGREESSIGARSPGERGDGVSLGREHEGAAEHAAPARVARTPGATATARPRGTDPASASRAPAGEVVAGKAPVVDSDAHLVEVFGLVAERLWDKVSAPCTTDVNDDQSTNPTDVAHLVCDGLASGPRHTTDPTWIVGNLYECDAFCATEI